MGITGLLDLTDTPGDLSPAAFAAELEALDPNDPIAKAWKWRLDGGGRDFEWAPPKWHEAQLAYLEWHDRAALRQPGVAAHLSELGQRGPRSGPPTRSATVDGVAITKTVLSGIVAVLDDLVDAQSVLPGRQARWRREVDRLRDLVGELQRAET